MKRDRDIQQDVEAALRLGPDVDATDFAAKVDGGVVTLSGYARNYCEKNRALQAIECITGVAAVADEVQVRLPAADGLTDPEIARHAVASLRLVLPAGGDAVQAIVNQREVRLEGSVGSNSERERAENAVRRLPGVTAVHNCIRINTGADPVQIRDRIEQALQRSVLAESRGICVQTHGSEVTLTGEVGTRAESEEAEAAARSTPGVSLVRSALAIKG